MRDNADITAGLRIGRARELQQLRALAKRAAAGQGAVAVVTGEPGIGKTWLAGAALADCNGRGFETYVATAWEMEQRRPFGVIADALRLREARYPSLAGIGRLLRGGDGGDAGLPLDPAAVEFQVAERVVEYVEDRAAAAPVAMVLEDLQWADPSSLMALGWLAREGTQLPLLLVCTLRPGPARAEVGVLLASLGRLGVSRLELGPLSEDEVADLVAVTAGGPPGGRLLRLAASANGNPLHVKELVAALEADGSLMAGPDGQVEVAGGQLATSLRQTVLHRLAALPEPSLGVLRTAAVLGSAFTVGELEVVLSRPAGELAGGLHAAMDAGVLVEEEIGLAFRHELIREALYEDMPQVLRRAQHREAAVLLARAGMPIERVAAHWVAGAGPADVQAVDWLRRAAREVAGRSPAEAVELLQRARDLCPAGEPARAEIARELVQPLAWAGRRDELEALCRRALEAEGRPEDQMMFRTGLAHSLFIQGHLAEAQVAYQQAAATAAPDQPQRTMLAAYAALSGVMAGEVASAETARQIASGDGEPVTSGIARLAMAVAELNAGRADRAVAEFEALAAEGPADRWGLQLLRAAALLDLDQVEAARTVLREGARDCGRTGTAARTAIHHHNLVAVEYAAADFDAALAEHDTGLALAEASGHHWQVISLGVAAAIAVHRGDLVQAAKMIKVADDQVESFGPHPADHEAARARYLLAQASGDTRLALDAASQAWQRCAAHGYRSRLTWLGADLAGAALAAGEPGLAAGAAAAAEQAARIAPAACWAAGAARARGLAADDPDLLLHAVALLRASHRPLYLALALEDAAEALARTGRAAEARPLATESLDLFAAMGAVTDAARARRRWRAASLRLGTRGPRSRSRTGWESLSDSELRVVRLVAEGRTNRDIAARLFITRDTVHTHISHSLRKLGLSSRVELAAYVARRGLWAGPA